MSDGNGRGEPRMGPELDALVLASVMGWQWVPLRGGDGSTRQLLWDPAWGRPADHPSADEFRTLPGGRLVPWDAPRPSADANAARDVEERVAQRRLQYPYTVALVAMLQGGATKKATEGWREAWAAARATPEQRCRAALRAVGLSDDQQLPPRHPGTCRARPKMLTSAGDAHAPPAAPPVPQM